MSAQGTVQIAAQISFELRAPASFASRPVGNSSNSGTPLRDIVTLSALISIW